MFHLHPKHEPEWEIAEYKEIEQVPVYFENSDIQISSILSENISQVYFFDAPPRSKGKQPATTPPATPAKRLSLCPSTSSRKFRLRLPRSSSSSSSTTSSSSGSDTEDSASWAAPVWPTSDGGFTLSQTRAAVEFARSQLLESPELQRLGVNFLVSEGWSVTRRRKGENQRLEVRYTGRPARVVFSGTPRQSSPPFIDLLASL